MEKSFKDMLNSTPDEQWTLWASEKRWNFFWDANVVIKIAQWRSKETLERKSLIGKQWGVYTRFRLQVLGVLRPITTPLLSYTPPKSWMDAKAQVDIFWRQAEADVAINRGFIVEKLLTPPRIIPIDKLKINRKGPISTLLLPKKSKYT
jgi:hypothetical protein